LQSLVDLGDQLPRPVPGPKLKRAVGLDARPVGDIGLHDAALGEAGQGSVGFPEQFILPAEQLAPEILDLQGIHELFVLARTIVLRQRNHHAARLSAIAHRHPEQYVPGRLGRLIAGEPVDAKQIAASSSFCNAGAD
jgi:hypothetical protein